MNLYDATASIYNRRYREIQRRKYEHIRSIFTGSGYMLDVGCGTGLLLCFLGESLGVLVGVDTSARMLRIASKHLRKRIIRSALIRADADSLPFRDNIFANVASVTVLQNLNEPLRTIREIARVMTPGGRIAISCLRKRINITGLRTIISASAPSLETTSEWDNDEEDVGVNATKTA
jgi:ubiquinone/menaquinone biosynthesis C-methylase UbiE